MLRGLAIGTADVMPGVSGGTMALVLGIYERLITALRAVTSLSPWRLLARGRVRGAWRAAHAPFLAPLVAGIAVAVLVLARVIEQALEFYAVPLYAVFTGLILAAALLVGRRVSRWSAAPIFATIAAAGALTLLLSSAPGSPPDAAWMMFVSGAVGITALVLPGVSGAFILVLLGQYGRVISAIASLDLVTLAPFALGALVGIATVARVLDVLLKRARDVTMAAILGVMVGSLQRIWPWTAEGAGSTRLAAPDGPWGLEGWVLALIVALLAFGVVVGMDRAARVRAAARDVSSTS